ncbi:hypothetical protein Tco_1298467 [Tanacetum coccineum]
MAAVEVPQTLEYKCGQLKATLVLEVENFTNWKKRFMCHILDDQMNSVINCLTAKPTWDDLNNYLSENCYKVLFCKNYERTDHRTCDHAEYISTKNMS